MIRLLLVDDHKVVREALCSVLEREADIVVVGQAGDGEIALVLVAELMPELVLMDIAMPGMSGIEVTRRISAGHPGVRVLALSTYSDKRVVTQMLEAGAAGFVNKAGDRDELLQGIRAVAAGKPYLCQEIAAMLIKPQSGVEAQLGRREIEVLQLLVDGSTSAEIASRLHIATSTVEVHRRNIMRKLDLHSIAELTKYAIRQGLITA